jgi:hypothetical protein
MALQRGLPSSELLKLKARLSGINNTGNRNNITKFKNSSSRAATIDSVSMPKPSSKKKKIKFLVLICSTIQSLVLKWI